jgi:YqaJ-like viral recombinase domain
MAREILFELEQNTDAWIEARLGLPTASMFAALMRGGDAKTRTDYMRKLAGERLTGRPMDNYSSSDMLRGHEWEAEARTAYCLLADVDVRQVGFIKNGKAGYSPDGLIEPHLGAGVEFKTRNAHRQIELLLKGTMPPEHMAQCQGALWVGELEYIDLVIFSKSLPLFRHQVVRDEPFIRDLEIAVDMFEGELRAMVEKIRRMGGQAAAA